MTRLPDTSALRGSARRIDAAADEVTSHARTAWAAADHVQWVSLAATRFRSQSQSYARDLAGAADGLREAAAELRAHADAVEQLVQAALVVPGAVVKTGEDALRSGIHAIRSLL